MAALLGALFLAACEPNRKHRAATEAHFAKHRAAYVELVTAIQKHSSYDNHLSYDVDALFPHDRPRFSNHGGFLWVEFAPVNFYYNIVYADTRQTLEGSEPMTDEGTLIKTFGNGWYLVRRGWM
jgi:hypothetical protein